MTAALAAVSSARGRFMTPREVAEMLRVSPSMVRALTRRGDLPATYIGRLPRYEEADVSAFLARQRAKGRP